MDKRNIKSQSSLEFLILTGFALVIFITVLALLSKNIYFMNKNKQDILGEDIATKIQKEVLLASNMEDGYKREFSIPSMLGNQDYTISIINNEVILQKGIQNFWKEIPSVSGNITKGNNIIRKTNGTIYLN
jgi:hypothetical protein